MAVFHVATESRQRGAIERPTRSEVASSGKQIVAVLMVSPDCPRSEAEEWRVSWRGLTSRLEARAEPMHKVAVSVDIDPKRASRFLNIFGEFDEYTVGGGWNSSGVLWFADRELAGPLVVPQVVLISRTMFDESTGAVGGDSLIARLLTPDDVKRWTERETMRQHQAPNEEE